MKGPRVYDASGIPLHADNETVIKERIYSTRPIKNLLHDDITTIDHALTRPWVVDQAYRRIASDKPLWFGQRFAARAMLMSASARRFIISAATAVDARREGPAAAGSALFQEVQPVRSPDKKTTTKHVRSRGSFPKAAIAAPFPSAALSWSLARKRPDGADDRPEQKQSTEKIDILSEPRRDIPPRLSMERRVHRTDAHRHDDGRRCEDQ